MSSPHGPRTKWRETVNCGCKVNLRLKVTGRRPDGLHDLSSCFIFLEHPGDRLTVEESGSGITLECPGFPELAGEGNLAFRAAALYAGKSGVEGAWRIVLEKNVPTAAGLGGGSADAGAVLAILNRRYRAFDDRELSALAFSLGADVPFFLLRRHAWVTGAGENTEALDELPELPEILIVNPGFPVSAGWAFSHLPGELIGPDDMTAKASFISGCADWKNFCINDLSHAVMKKFPLLGMIRGRLEESGALAVQLSGSGPSLFALFRHGADAAAADLRAKFGDMAGLRIFTGGAEF